MVVASAEGLDHDVVQGGLGQVAILLAEGAVPDRPRGPAPEGPALDGGRRLAPSS